MATPSDYRLKIDISPLQGALDTVMRMRPVHFHYKDEKRNSTERDGFIAHEMQAIAPYAVSGEKDAVDASGKPIYQNMNYGEITPLLAAAIQELKAANDNMRRENDELRRRVERLEYAK